MGRSLPRSGTLGVVDPVLLDRLASDILRRARAHLPAVITSYSSATGRARATIGLVGQQATGQVDTPIPLVDAPVVWPRFGGFSLVGPLQPGNTCLACIADRSIDRWLLAGGNVPLESDRMHEITDAVLIPGLVPLTLPPPALGAAGLYLGQDAGTAYLQIVGPAVNVVGETVRLGGPTAAQAAMLGTQLVAALIPIASAVNAIPPAADLATSVAAINSTLEALGGVIAALQDAVSTTVFVE